MTALPAAFDAAWEAVNALVAECADRAVGRLRAEDQAGSAALSEAVWLLEQARRRLTEAKQVGTRKERP